MSGFERGFTIQDLALNYCSYMQSIFSSFPSSQSYTTRFPLCYHIFLNLSKLPFQHWDLFMGIIPI